MKQSQGKRGFDLEEDAVQVLTRELLVHLSQGCKSFLLESSLLEDGVAKGIHLHLPSVLAFSRRNPLESGLHSAKSGKKY